MQYKRVLPRAISAFHCLVLISTGFDERLSYMGGMFGAGIYFAENSSKSNQYVFGYCGGNGCATHKNRSCYHCPRQMLMCRVTLGKAFLQFSAMKVSCRSVQQNVLGIDRCCPLSADTFSSSRLTAVRGIFLAVSHASVALTLRIYGGGAILKTRYVHTCSCERSILCSFGRADLRGK